MWRALAKSARHGVPSPRFAAPSTMRVEMSRCATGGRNATSFILCPHCERVDFTDKGYVGLGATRGYHVPVLKNLSAALALVAILGGTEIAQADVTAAGKAFSEGQAAQLSEDYQLAAQKFELAHSIMPSSAALRSAARMRFKAGNQALAATHALSLQADYPDDPESVALAAQLLEQLAPLLTRLVVTCEAPCTLSSNGRAVSVDKAKRHEFFVQPGAIELQAWFDGGAAADAEVDAQAGASFSVEFAPPAGAGDAAEPALAPVAQGREDEAYEPTPPPDVRRREGAHPAWFYTGLGLTVVGGAATTWLGLETQRLRDDFDAQPTRATYDDGMRTQLQTNIAAGVTAALGITTVILAFVTDFDGPGASEPGVVFTPSGVAGRF